MDITDILRKHFGEDAEITELYWGGLRITTDQGEIDFNGDRFEHLVGGPEMYTAMLLCAEELWGSLAVYGSSKHIAAALQHGALLGVDVIPEVRDDGAGDGALLWGIPIFGGSYWIASFLFSGWQAFASAAAVTICICYGLILPGLETQARRRARRAGQDYRDVFPNMHSERRAREEDARRKGFI